jgi:hypothetical protein
LSSRVNGDQYSRGTAHLWTGGLADRISQDIKSKREKIMRLAAPIKIGVPALIILAIAAVMAMMAWGNGGLVGGGL